ncbi:MAG: translesion error-prone DNA polymerase V autoproteolytic subunit [Flavobacteriaceae bacterium]|nr:translesion error-prone DNA polymerase V autoproteolytic subunit [Flavobacteriaceae bacterium]
MTSLKLLPNINCGFPSPAEDFTELRISLDEHFIRDREATFFVRANGHSMEQDGISDGDLLIVDRSIEPFDGCVAVCYVDSEFTVKRVVKKADKVLLVGNRTIELDEGSELIVWGIVTYAVKKIS